ncbi:histidine kinase [Burkholderia latens]|uniref:ATP-binding protein n=1 Tax=Burkholderia TaxID=32008 RepID=UPI000ACC3D3E|nr:MULTISPECIES: ATP-binding protein [Burkholderia]
MTCLRVNASTVCGKPIFTDEELAWIDTHPVVHIAVEANWRPIEYMRAGRHAGLVEGYLNAIAKMTGLTFVTVPGTEWGNAYEALASRKVDLLPGVWRELAPERAGSNALVSSPYLVGRLTAVTRNNSAMIFALKRLEGRRVAIKGRGAVEYFARHSGVKFDLLTFDTEELALAAVANGDADAALGVDVTILPIVRRRFTGQLYMSGMLADRPVSLAMLTRADLPILASIIDKSLAAIPVSETAMLTRDWVELADYGKPTFRSIVHYRLPQVVAIGAVLIILAILSFLLWKSRAAAIRSKRDKAMFLAFVCHELRAPLHTILSAVELLQRSPLSGRQASRADAAASAAETLMILLDDILEYSRLESRKVTLVTQPVDLAAWANQITEMVRSRAEEKSLSLVLDVGGVAGVRGVIDPVRVRQIALNLLINAINYTPSGSVALRVDYVPLRHGRNGTLVVEVTDTGVGIEPDRMASIFDAYWRAEADIKGTGLGLAICRELVHLMRGSITIDSIPHIETTVTVRLPIDVDAQASEQLPGATAASAGGDVPHVLIVDDNELVRRAMKDQCEELGCAALTAGTADAAMQLLGDVNVDLVLLDCNLPGISGYTLARKIRQRESMCGMRRVPIIAISAVTGDAHKVRCFDSGIDGVLSKPLRLDTLRQAISMWCPACERSDASAPDGR